MLLTLRVLRMAAELTKLVGIATSDDATSFMRRELEVQLDADLVAGPLESFIHRPTAGPSTLDFL